MRSCISVAIDRIGLASFLQSNRVEIVDERRAGREMVLGDVLVVRDEDAGGSGEEAAQRVNGLEIEMISVRAAVVGALDDEYVRPAGELEHVGDHGRVPGVGNRVTASGQAKPKTV